jgi:DNA-binding transcriptional MerR regulator
LREASAERSVSAWLCRRAPIRGDILRTPSMNDRPPDFVIPDRASFKATEVCELLKVQPYVLRSWESEFKDLGVAKTPGGPRVYRRRDVERVARIKQYVFGEGLTLAGVRRRLEQELPAAPVEALEEDEAGDEAPARGAAYVADMRLRQRVAAVRAGLRDLLQRLSTTLPAAPPAPADPGEFVLEPPRATGETVPAAPAARVPRRRRPDAPN